MPSTYGSAIGMWIGVVGLEVVLAKGLGKKIHNLRQSISNLAASMLTFLFLLAVDGLQRYPYEWVHNNFGFGWKPQNILWVHLAGFLIYDFGYYWFHRLEHEWNLGWAGHQVHHASMDYNLSNAQRQGLLEQTYSWLAYLPAALACPFDVFLTHRAISAVYQAFLHTDLITKFWWPIELIMNTPSHHRVHHARNYGRKNHGGILIVWDKLFDTFQQEREDKKPIYGLNAQEVVQGTYNPLWHQFHHLVATVRLAASGKAPVSKVLFTRLTGPGMVHSTVTAAPDEQPATTDESPAVPAKRKAAGRVNIQATAGAAAAPAAATTRSSKEAFDPAYPWDRRNFTALDVYATSQFFLMAVPAICVFMNNVPHMSSVADKLIGGAFSVWTLTTLAWLCGGEAIAMKHEMVRLVAQILLAVRMLKLGTLPLLGAQLAGGSVALAAVSFLFLASQLPAPAASQTQGKAAKKVA